MFNEDMESTLEKGNHIIDIMYVLCTSTVLKRALTDASSGAHCRSAEYHWHGTYPLG